MSRDRFVGITRRSFVPVFISFAGCSLMSSLVTATPNDAASVLYDGEFSELFVAYTDATSGALHTAQFFERRPDLGKVSVLKRVPWEHNVKGGAQLLMPESGWLRNRLKNFWIAWQEGPKVFALSILQEEPLAVDLGGARIIGRPMMDGEQDLHIYALAGRQVMLHRITSVLGSPPVHRVAELIQLDHEPSLFSSVPLPGQSRGAALLGFVHEDKGSVVSRVLRIQGGKLESVSTDPAPNAKIFSRQRIALHSGVENLPELGVLVVSPEGSYSTLRAVFNLVEKTHEWNRVEHSALKPGSLRSAANFFYKGQSSPQYFLMAVNADKQLLLPRGSKVTVLRNDVDEGFAFPVLTTYSSRYEVVGAGADVALRSF